MKYYSNWQFHKLSETVLVFLQNLSNEPFNYCIFNPLPFGEYRIITENEYIRDYPTRVLNIFRFCFCLHKAKDY